MNSNALQRLRELWRKGWEWFWDREPDDPSSESLKLSFIEGYRKGYSRGASDTKLVQKRLLLSRGGIPTDLKLGNTTGQKLKKPKGRS